MTTIATYGLILLLTVLLILHVSILSKLIPYAMIWGGRLKSDKEMYRFETVSIFINLLFLFIVFIKANILPIPLDKKILNTALWFMTFIFLLNTMGNLNSKNRIERKYFTVITVILAILSMILARAN